ncbi:MAG: hypothetical protein R2800_10060 [Flavipsychrobacter sp.]
MMTNDSLKNQKNLPVILFMGASESSGYGLADQKSFVDIFYQLVENERPQKYMVINASIPGASTSDLKELLNRTNVNKNTISHLVITLGLSDAIYQTPPTEIYNNLKEGINYLKEQQPTMKIWVMRCDMFQHHAISGLPLKNSPYYVNFRKAFDDIGKEKQVQIFPFYNGGYYK